MNIKDPWKYLAFPISALVAYFSADILVNEVLAIVNTTEMNARLGILAATGLVVGFIVDEMVPVYIQKVREGSSGSDSGGIGGDSGGEGFDSGGEDFDFE